MADDTPKPPYVHQDYPAHRHHATLPYREVKNPEEDALLGPGWYKSPGNIPESEKVKAAAVDTDALAAENEDLKRQLAEALAAKAPKKAKE